MKTPHYVCTSPEQVHHLLATLAPRTAVVDIEPLIANWGTGVDALDEGLAQFLESLSDLPSLEYVAFATNSPRRPTELRPAGDLTVTYYARAQKPFRTSPYRGLPRPGVVIGDQIPTEGLLAHRLGYTFIQYQVPFSSMNPGPKFNATLGRPIRPFFLTRKEHPAT